MGERRRKAEALGDQPIEEAYREKMIAMAKALDEFLNDGKHGGDRETGFVLLVFPFGEAEAGRCNFISNGADRKDVAALFKEMIARFEGQPEVVGRA
jgi:hypothetical protein